MRTVFVALIFIGCLSLAFGVDPVIIPTRPAGATCAAAGTPVSGCTSCITNPDQGTVGTIPFVCQTQTEGYFIDAATKQAVACPRACKKCTGLTACLDADCATLGFVAAAAPVVACQKCKAGWTYDNGVASSDNNTNLNAVCISVTADSPNICFTGFNWDSLPTSSRLCVANAATGCAAGYAKAAAAANTANCDQCATGYSNIKSSFINGDNKYYWTQNCIKQVALPTIVPPGTCAVAGTPVQGCTTCGGAGQCTLAADGYYLEATTRLRGLANEPNANTGKVLACQPQCKTCKDGKSCDTCDATTGYVTAIDAKGYCACDATKGYTSSIPWDNVKLGQAVTYNCVNQAAGQTCSANYVFASSSQILTTTMIMPNACLSPILTTACYKDVRPNLTDQPEYSITSYWSETPNPKRTCVLASGKKCDAGYATDPKWTDSTSTTPLAGDCEQCIVGYSVSGAAGSGAQTCVKNTSSILAMSLAFLGIMLALLF